MDKPNRSEGKQRVIEMIADRLLQARGFQLYDAWSDAENLYEQIALLIRGEFPVEEFDSIMDHVGRLRERSRHI